MKIEDIKKLIDAAAGGPWEYDNGLDDYYDTAYIRSPNFSTPIIGVASEGAHARVDDERLVAKTICDTNHMANARFIIAARTYMPKLIAVAEAAKASVGNWNLKMIASPQKELVEALKALESE